MGPKLGPRLGKSLGEAFAKPEVEKSGCSWRLEPVWAPCGSWVTQNQAPKELPLQQLEGVEQVGDGEMARLG